MASAWASRRSVIRGRVVRRAVGGVCIVLSVTACGHPAAPSSAPEPSSRLIALLGDYYGPREAAGPTPGAVALGGCRADEGDTCFGGDHEDQLCRRVPGCRSDAARSRFLEALGAGARAEPRSAGWVGHAVYAHTRMDRPVTALDLASECSAERTWCGLLMGLALHRNGRALDAESAFRSALDESPLECLLRDVGPLLDDTARELYASWSCNERSEFDRRFWWMTDPSLAEAGNPRWVEHVARGVERILHRQILDAVRSHHPEHHDDQVVRRGAEDSFDDEGRFAGLRSACCHFVPESGGPEEPLDLLRYRLASDRGREGFTPADGPVLDTQVQWARFEADDQVEIVGISEAKGAMRLTWSPGPEQVDRLGLVHPEPSGRVEAIARVAPTEGLLDLESEGTAPRVRARLGVNAWPQGRLRVSDLLSSPGWAERGREQPRRGRRPCAAHHDDSGAPCRGPVLGGVRGTRRTTDHSDPEARRAAPRLLGSLGCRIRPQPAEPRRGAVGCPIRGRPASRGPRCGPGEPRRGDPHPRPHRPQCRRRPVRAPAGVRGRPLTATPRSSSRSRRLPSKRAARTPSSCRGRGPLPCRRG